MALVLAEVVIRLVPLVHDKSLVLYEARPGDEGQSPRPNQSVHTLLGRLETTNAHGLRDPHRGLERSDVPEFRRVALVGDSVVWGFGLEDDEVLARRLERRLGELDPLRTWEVWSLAQPATTQLNHAARYERMGSELKPDLVVVTVLFNDLLPGATSFRVTGGGMLASPHRGAPYPDGLRPLVDRSASFQLAMMALYAWEKRANPNAHAFDLQHLPALLGGLTRIEAAARRDGAAILLALVPGRYEDPESYITLRDAVEAWSRVREVGLVDLADTLGSPLREEHAQKGDSTHPNAHGIDLAAQALAPEVIRLAR